MAQSEYRSDGTRYIGKDSKDNPRLGAKLLTDGSESLFLEYYGGYTIEKSKSGVEYKKPQRRREYLKLYVYPDAKDSRTRKSNREALETAQLIRLDKAQQMMLLGEGYKIHRPEKVDVIRWMEIYESEYTKKDVRIVRRARVKFAEFLSTSNKYWRYAGALNFEDVTPDMIRDYADWLSSICKGEGARSAFARFKKMFKDATKAGLIDKTPCEGISVIVDTKIIRKEILSEEEMTRLIATHYQGENPDIRRAFIFCMYTGLRWCDVKELRFSNVDFSNRRLKFEQSKTSGHSCASGVVLPLNDGLLKVIGKGKKDDLIFPLPTHTMCLKALEHWTRHAGIDKHITWHCARHSFATNILSNGANIKTVASLLGHSSLQHTEKYTRAVDSLKVAAINSLPQLDI